MAVEQLDRGGDVAARSDRAVRVLGSLADLDVPLAPMTTYRVGGAAAVFVRPATVDDLVAVATAWRETALPMLVVGRGSNLLVADDGHPGIAVSLLGLSNAITLGEADDEGRVVVDAGGAVSLPVLARRTVAASITGFEWAVGVPGSVGGGVRMNAGGHGSDMASCLADVDLFDLSIGVEQRVAAGELGLRFRGSDLADHQLVLSARLTLARGSREQSVSSTRSSAGAARTSRAVRTPARCSSTRCPAR
ncbi:MAG: FAD-binding protein [Actinobacteria bacterium]|nr:FAD-binding protein [Actinomycetota bacterium]